MTKDKIYKGNLAAETIEVRFPFSGKVARVLKKLGERIATGELLASLDTKVLQAELDKELADYERVRAEFELFGLRVKDPQTDVEKYEKTRMQGFLNASIKAVELVKYRMDQMQLTSPVAGIIVSDDGLRPGMYITPGSYGFGIIDMATLRFELEVSWSEIEGFKEGTEVKLLLAGKAEEFIGQVLAPFPHPKNNTCLVRIKLQKTEGLWPGMPGEVRLGSEQSS